MCRPCSIVLKSCYFDYRINKPFTCSCCLVSVSCAVYTTFQALHGQRIMGFLTKTTHKYTRSENHCMANIEHICHFFMIARQKKVDFSCRSSSFSKSLCDSVLRFKHLDAMVKVVSNKNVSVWGHCDTFRFVELSWTRST